MEITDAAERKKQFAVLQVESPASTAFAIASELFPSNTGMALWVANHWPEDAEVKAEIKRLRGSDSRKERLADEVDLANTVWEMTQRGPMEDRIKAAKLYAEIRGFIKKEQPAVNVNLTQNKVMVVRDKGTNEEWEMGVAKQQAELLNANATRH